MTVLDCMNWIGQRKQLRPVGAVLHWAARKLPFSLLPKMAGRRMVSASAGAPAVLLTHGNMEDAFQDPGLLCQATRFSVEEMELDTAFLPVDLSVEAEACGCQLRFSERDLPMIVSHPLQESQDLDDLKVPDPHCDGRMPVFLEAMRRIGRDCAMITNAEVIGPFTLATHLTGAQVYLDTALNPEWVKRILEYCTQVAIAYTKALIEAGADVIVLVEPAGSQLSPAAYVKFSQAYSERIIRGLTRPCILHICGRAGHIVEKMCQSAAAGISVDDVDFPALIRSAPKRMVVVGNLSPLMLAGSSPEDIRTQTLELLECVGERKEYIAAPGCDLAPDTPLENIKAFVQTVKGYRP